MLELEGPRPAISPAQANSPVAQPAKPEASAAQSESAQASAAAAPAASASLPTQSRVEIRPGLQSTAPGQTSGAQTQQPAPELGRLLEDLNARMQSPERGKPESMQAMYQLSLPIVAALRASLKSAAATRPTPRTDLVSGALPWGHTPYELRNQDQLKRFTGFFKELKFESFAKTLGLPESPRLKELHHQLGRQILSWTELEAALKQSDLPTSGLENLADAQARWLSKGQGADSVLVIMSSPRDQDQLNLSQEQSHLKDQIGRKRVFSLANPDPLEIRAMLRTGAFSQLWLSGHGAPGFLLLTDDKGRSNIVSHQDFVAMLPTSPKLKGVVTNLCYGGLGGDRSLVDLLKAKGMAATGYEAPVKDRLAIGLAAAIGKAMQAGASITEAVDASFAAVYPKRQAFIETGDTVAGLPRYQIAADAKAMSDDIGHGIAQLVDKAFQLDTQAAADRLELCLREYPGLVKVFALVTALTKGDAAQVRDLQIDHPELILVRQEAERRKATGSKSSLLYEAVLSYVSLQHLDGKPFLQSARPEVSP